MIKEEIIAVIRATDKYKGLYKHAEYLPEPYCEDIRNVKAIVLGCDPSNKEGNTFEKVFDLGNSNRFFWNIENNLNLIGLSRSDIYMDNLCRNYFTVETSENKVWYEIAIGLWVPYQKTELDKLFPPEIPVLATSHYILKAICYKKYYTGKNEEYYNNCLLIKPCQNTLRRTVIPFFRHYYYKLENWPDYANSFKGMIFGDTKTTGKFH